MDLASGTCLLSHRQTPPTESNSQPDSGPQASPPPVLRTDWLSSLHRKSQLAPEMQQQKFNHPKYSLKSIQKSHHHGCWEASSFIAMQSINPQDSDTRFTWRMQTQLILTVAVVYGSLVFYLPNFIFSPDPLRLQAIFTSVSLETHVPINYLPNFICFYISADVHKQVNYKNIIKVFKNRTMPAKVIFNIKVIFFFKVRTITQSLL